MTDPKRDNASESLDPKREWVRERLVCRLYEPLSPEEEAEVEAYLEKHPELRDIEREYEEISCDLSTLDTAEEPLSDTELEALFFGGRERVVKLPTAKRTRMIRWLASAAAVACLVALLVTQGAVVQVGSVRITMGHFAGPAVFSIENTPTETQNPIRLVQDDSVIPRPNVPEGTPRVVNITEDAFTIPKEWLGAGMFLVVPIPQQPGLSLPGLSRVERQDKEDRI